MTIAMLGALCFGVVMGWITYRTLRRREGSAALSDIAAVIGALGGGAITALFSSQELFGWYCVGLFFGFFSYFVVGMTVKDAETVSKWMGN